MGMKALLSNYKRAYSGCCPEYSASNRNKVRMVVGWHQDESA